MGLGPGIDPFSLNLQTREQKIGPGPWARGPCLLALKEGKKAVGLHPGPFSVSLQKGRWGWAWALGLGPFLNLPKREEWAGSGPWALGPCLLTFREGKKAVGLGPVPFSLSLQRQRKKGLGLGPGIDPFSLNLQRHEEGVGRGRGPWAIFSSPSKKGRKGWNWALGLGPSLLPFEDGKEEAGPGPGALAS